MLIPKNLSSFTQTRWWPNSPMVHPCFAAVLEGATKTSVVQASEPIEKPWAVSNAFTELLSQSTS